MIRPFLLDVVRELKRRPKMHLTDPTYESICAYIIGYDHCLLAVGKGDVGLDGFREWIVARNGGGVESHWIELIATLAGTPDATDLRKRDTLFTLFEEFWIDRDARGVQAITDDFNATLGH